MIVEFYEQPKPGSTHGFRGNLDPAFNLMWCPKHRGEVVGRSEIGGKAMMKVKVDNSIHEVEVDRCKVIDK